MNVDPGLTSQASAEQPTRKRGRPVKLTPEFFNELLTRHEQAVEWFVTEHGCRPVSDAELYEAVNADECRVRGDLADPGDEGRTEKKLRTLQNQLAKARAWKRESQPTAIACALRDVLEDWLK